MEFTVTHPLPTTYCTSMGFRILCHSKHGLILPIDNNFEQMLKSYTLKNTEFQNLVGTKDASDVDEGSHCREGERALPGLKEPY